MRSAAKFVHSWLTNPVSRFFYRRFGAGSVVARRAEIIGRRRVSIGAGVRVMPGASLICSGMPPYLFKRKGTISIGDGSIIRENSFLITYGGNIELGSRVTVNPFCCIQGNCGVEIGDDVLIASHVSIFSANHVFEDASRTIRSQGERGKGVRIADDVWIGSHSVILDGVTINRGAVIAAGAVVTREVPAFAVVAGVPARKIGQRGPSIETADISRNRSQ